MTAVAFDAVASLLYAALEYAHTRGASGQPRPDLADAERLTWQLVDLAIEAKRSESWDV